MTIRNSIILRAFVRLFAGAIIWLAKRDPYIHLAGYMDRYWLLRPRSWFPWSIRVHHILRSDIDRHLHDHPWPWASLILRGGYYEVTPGFWGEDDLAWWPEGSFRAGAADDRHRLVVDDGETVWTLFFMGPYFHKWGFYAEAGKVPWDVYLPKADVEATVEAMLEQGIRRPDAG